MNNRILRCICNIIEVIIRNLKYLRLNLVIIIIKIIIILRELYKELYFVPDFVHLKAIIAYVAPSSFPIRGK